MSRHSIWYLSYLSNAITQAGRPSATKSRFALALFSLAFSVSLASAQIDPARGILPFSTQIAGPDYSVDMATSNIHLSIPIRTKEGKIPVHLTLDGNNHVYKYFSSFGSGAYTFLPESYLRQILDVEEGGELTWTTQADVFCHGVGGDEVFDHFAVIDRYGGRHDFPATLAMDTGGCAPGWKAPMVTEDGSGYTGLPATMPSGVVLHNASGMSGAGNVRTDPDGSTILFGGSSPPYTITDTLNQTVLSTSSSGSAETYTYTDIQGRIQTYTVTYGSFTLQSNFKCPGISDYGDTHAAATPPVSITSPSGAVTTLSYEPTPGYSQPGPVGPYTTGRLASILYPTGSSVTFGYSGGNNGISCSSANSQPVVPILTITVKDGGGHSSVWTYENNGSGVVTETDPIGNQTVHNFSIISLSNSPRPPSQIVPPDFWTEASNQVYQGPVTGGVLLKSTFTCHNGNNINTSQTACTGSFSVPVTQTDDYTFLYNTSGGSSGSLTTTVFDCKNTPSACYGLPVDVKQYDWGQTFPPSGSPLSETQISYGSSAAGAGCVAIPNITNKPCSVTKLGPSGQVVVQTNYTYNSTGHPITTSRLISGSTYATSSATYNSNGTVATVTDANNNTVSVRPNPSSKESGTVMDFWNERRTGSESRSAASESSRGRSTSSGV